MLIGRWCPMMWWPGSVRRSRTRLRRSCPTCRVWITKPFWGLEATLERLHADRQLEESLVHGPDPLHLTAVFGIHQQTAIRYANAARQLLTTAAEEQAPTSSREPMGRDTL
jgi:hypothetical protein